MPAWRRYIRASASGFSLVELLVAITIGSVMCAMAVSGVLANRKLYQHDLARTRLTQDLRSSLEFLGVNIREAGENLPESVPAVEVVDGADGAPDELILRRSLIDEVPKLCQPISAGSAITSIYFAYPGTEAGCTYSANEGNYQAWYDYRVAHDGVIDAYIYDPYTQLGEFFEVTGEAKGVSMMSLVRSSGSFANAYTVGQSTLFVMEEWHFLVSNDLEGNPIFQIIENGDSANPRNVTHGVTDFQVVVHMTDGTTKDGFSRTDAWVDIVSIEITISGREEVSDVTKTALTASYNTRFFPRNILSH